MGAHCPRTGESAPNSRPTSQNAGSDEKLARYARATKIAARPRASAARRTPAPAGQRRPPPRACRSAANRCQSGSGSAGDQSSVRPDSDEPVAELEKAAHDPKVVDEDPGGLAV